VDKQGLDKLKDNGRSRLEVDWLFFAQDDYVTDSRYRTDPWQLKWARNWLDCSLRRFLLWAVTAIRGFLKFCKENQIIFGNPAETVEGPIREEKEPAILLKTEYKALLQVAGEQVRHKAKSQERNTLH
jgi:integrase